ncbi:MAG: hypothetical protein HYY06_03470 [Deltaproteobacteria bacterium]|nr:hypothetical protein [Deltaproteobacteria bacterium]
MDVAVASVPTRVRGRSMTRHRAQQLGGDRAAQSDLVLVASAGGPPTLWKRGLDKVIAAFTGELGQPRPDGVETSMRAAYAAARRSLVGFRETLLGPGPDVMLVALHLSPGRAAVLVGGAGRVYLHRRKGHERLTAFEDLEGGLVDHPEPWFSSASLHGGDLLVAGSLEAFELPAIGSVAARLSLEPGADVRAIAEILLGPARESGIGAAAAVVRV